ncbi:neutral/alkaline non-lysosomal ceramidase N-terminal domain-containing protein [Paenibacillus sp. MBLB4367]|uniref:neutral/alkaline non-lysosomal ceramidase N-terminal domain-containing protein n=1 Tax=Paenibacillus sp. MBLB4367 TaxID=3384767 RepID=UPI003907FDBC
MERMRTVLKCGMAEVDVTPPLNSSMPGYFRDRKSTGVLDPLYAKAITVETEGAAAVLVAIDAIDLPRRVVLGIRERIHSETGIPQANIMVSATHTHTGPPVVTSSLMTADEAYLQQLTERAADAAILAYRGSKEARIGFGCGYEADMAFNRRFWMKDGTVRMNPGIGNTDAVRPEGPIDPQVLVIRIDAVDGSSIGVVTNYACHTDTVGGTRYSADYPGELSASLKRSLGGHVVSLFLMGASGNINHIDVSGGWPVQPEHHKVMGRILAGEVLKTREKARLADRVELGAAQAFFQVAYRKPSEEEAEEARRRIGSETVNEVEKAFASELLLAYAEEEIFADIEMQAIQLGPLAVVGCPGELFVELGLAIKAASPFAYTAVNELCNGAAPGYVCTREAFENGSYEPRITSNSRLPAETGELFVRHAEELLGRIYANRTETS